MMNKIKILAIALVVIMGLNSCEGDRGPQGPPGQDGMTLLGTTIDLNGVNLDNNGEFQYVFADDGIEVFEDDAVLVYHSTDFIENPDGDINIWKLMPQTIYYDPNGMGQVVYNFDHTFNDVLIFLQSNFDLNELSIEEYNSLTKDQYFRIVVVPSAFANDPNNNLETYQSLLNEVNNQGYEIQMKK
ncbi:MULTISPECIES: collagen-like protein [Mesonia]|uniref:Uncharacterized protein n=1 Tax=Mesonia oceanica TaxID=2687242 RepID=A0AC61Y673_9FLAO|nr:MULTISPECIES: collagen-like protein [Mesonia]VVV00001.1 hypothetical protein FVB9532_01262 [Mesonia oceanica]|tara:strand:- start:15671 stop:16228 length:558 start_codon:yes stop_codon:yes gene_type:complete